jgi:hypothetical protein
MDSCARDRKVGGRFAFGEPNMLSTKASPAPSLPPLPQYYGCRDVRRMLGGACNNTINLLIADGVLPEPIRLRKNMVLFEANALLQAVARMRGMA